MARSVVTIAGVSKAFNDRGLREFCPEGHRMFWPSHMTAYGRKAASGDLEYGSIVTGDNGYDVASGSTHGKINKGICTAGDYWVQQRSDVTYRRERPPNSIHPHDYPIGAKPRTGMEKATEPGAGSYDVGYNLNRETGQVIGHASLICALGHVSQKSGRVRDPDSPDADARGWVNRPSQTPVPDSIGEANAFVSGLISEGWELRDNRLLCPKCVVEFDELEHGFGNAHAIERLEHESANRRYEYRIVHRKGTDDHFFNPFDKSKPPQLVEGEVVTVLTDDEVRAAGGYAYGGHIAIRKANGQLLNVHPKTVKRVEIETDD
jgi:hypothetical protein